MSINDNVPPNPHPVKPPPNMPPPKQVSHPNRLSAFLTEHPEGIYCYYSDYAALAAENEQLKAKLSMSEAIAEICSQPPGEGAITVKASLSTGKTVLPDIFQIDELKAENERLRKHRDTLIERLDKAIEDIDRLAAKEGRDAK